MLMVLNTVLGEEISLTMKKEFENTMTAVSEK